MNVHSHTVLRCAQNDRLVALNRVPGESQAGAALVAHHGPGDVIPKAEYPPSRPGLRGRPIHGVLATDDDGKPLYWDDEAQAAILIKGYAVQDCDATCTVNNPNVVYVPENDIDPDLVGLTGWQDIANLVNLRRQLKLLRQLCHGEQQHRWLVGCCWWPVYAVVSSSALVVRYSTRFEVKFTIQINTGPFTQQASDTAYYFTRAALQAGHDIHRVFFYHDGVHNASSYAVPPQDDRGLQQLWSDLGTEYDLDMVVCVVAAQRRGIMDESESKKHVRGQANIATGFQISGLGQLIEAGVQSDRLLVFGD